MLGKPFRGPTPAAKRSPDCIPTPPCPPSPGSCPASEATGKGDFGRLRTFPGAEESGSQRSQKSSGKPAAPRTRKCQEASVQAVPSEPPTDHLGVPSAGVSAPGDPWPPWGARASLRGRDPAQGTPEGWSLGARHCSWPGTLGGCGGLPTPERAFGLGLGQSKCLPHASRQGGAGAASRCAAAPAGRRTGAGGV